MSIYKLFTTVPKTIVSSVPALLLLLVLEIYLMNNILSHWLDLLLRYCTLFLLFCLLSAPQRLSTLGQEPGIQRSSVSLCFLKLNTMQTLSKTSKQQRRS